MKKEEEENHPRLGHLSVPHRIYETTYKNLGCLENQELFGLASVSAKLHAH